MGDTLEVMTEEEEVDMTEVESEEIQEGSLEEVMGVREVMPQEEIEVTREDTTVDIAEADTNQEGVAIDLERMIAEDTLKGEIILPQIVTKVEVHHLLLHLILLPVDIAVDHQLKDLIDMARVVRTEVNTEAVAEVEITAQLTLLVIEKIVAMIQGAMTLVHEGIQLQEKTIMLVVADQPEAVLRQQRILDMQVKNVKRKQVIQLKGIKFIDNSKYKI